MPDRVIAHGKRPCVLHLSADFPDPIAPYKTPVIARLIDLVGDRYDHRVLSLNRRSPAFARLAPVILGRADAIDVSQVQPFEYGEALSYHAPPRGVMHATMLRRLGKWITRRLAETNVTPDLIIGHKLTVEGLVAMAVAEELGVPYAITIQGNTDQKILTNRPDLARRFGEVYRGAASVFCLAPWARSAVERRVGKRTGPSFDLPCPTVNDTIVPPRPGGENIISVFHLKNHAIKNLGGLVAAMRINAAEGKRCDLHIFGGGSPEEHAACKAVIGDAPGITLMGPRTQDELGAIMNGAAAFVMPSLRESFGLVFLEALFAGLPIIHPKGASIDGYFDGLPFAIPVNARRPEDIARAVRHVVENEAELKAALGAWQQAGGLQRFTRAAIARTFSEGIDAALAQGKPRRQETAL